MSSTVSLPSDAAIAPRVWWREPYLWLVILGPLAVVVAGLVTAAIAVRNPDPVLDARNTGQAARMAQAREAQAHKDSLTNLQPAMVGRNHAASPLPLPPVAGK
jgi:uncharacterized protein